jgi:hypothetical protein
MIFNPRDEEEIFDEKKLEKCLDHAREEAEKMDHLLDEIVREEQTGEERAKDFEKANQWPDG